LRARRSHPQRFDRDREFAYAGGSHAGADLAVADLPFDIDGAITTLTFNRPQARNALSNDLKARWRAAFESQLQLEAELCADCAQRADVREGVDAFVQKRRAVFTGQ
jgi:enoyl-CoA hydratase/carnithine racemase